MTLRCCENSISNPSYPAKTSISKRAQNATLRTQSAAAHTHRFCSHAGPRGRVHSHIPHPTPLGNLMGCPCSSTQRLPDVENPQSVLRSLIILSTKRRRQGEMLCAEYAELQQVLIRLDPALPSHSVNRLLQALSIRDYTSAASEPHTSGLASLHLHCSRSKSPRHIAWGVNDLAGCPKTTLRTS